MSEQDKRLELSPDDLVRVALTAFETAAWQDLFVLTDQDSLARFIWRYRAAHTPPVAESVGSEDLSDDLADVRTVDEMMALDSREFLTAWGRARTPEYRLAKALADLAGTIPPSAKGAVGKLADCHVIGSLLEREGRALVLVRQGASATEDVPAIYHVVPVERRRGGPWRLIMSHDWLGLGGPVFLVPEG